MYRLPFVLLSAFLLINAAAQAAGVCPLLGPVYPAPKQFSNNTTFDAAAQKISNKLDEAIRSAFGSQNPVFDANATSLALQIFSVEDSTPLLQYYYTSTLTQTATTGVRVVDENTVFRIGSVTKLLTVFLFLIEKGNVLFHEPVIKYVPELREAADDLRRNGIEKEVRIDYVCWEEVTIGELASQLSGISRQYALGDLSLGTSKLVSVGFSQLPEADIPPCGPPLSPCDRTQFFHGLLRRHPVVPSASTPIYSNAAFQILAYALEEMIGKSFPELLQRDLIDALGLTRSSTGKPADEYGIIPFNATTSLWSLDIREEIPAGGIYSSLKDMSTVGRAILNSTLLPLSLTRQWLKPASHTSYLSYSVGAPWEIYSFTEPRMIDLYTKAGQIGLYSSMLAVSPDHDVGFAILAAGPGAAEVTTMVSDIIATTTVPALEQVAKEEAHKRFSGTYSLTNGSDFSVTITVDGGPGLKVMQWINKSHNMSEAIKAAYGLTESTDVSIRLYPTGLQTSKKISFRSVIPSLIQGSSQGIGPFTRSCRTWMAVDGMVYGSVGVDEFVFEIDHRGRATAVSPRAMRVSLPRLLSESSMKGN
ncbi:serine hydrolase domain-containing protein [Aspergillus alliaceus]|nr:beta-lactamase/transpeptidase-like protein [Aspergillus alliaceus]KAB8232105.1 beta-lactamase/transpeptidase-like protein [Aspergillus alliaceus]